MKRAKHTAPEGGRWAKYFVAGIVLQNACGGAQNRLPMFSTNWEDDGGASIDRVWMRVRDSQVPLSADVIVGIAGNGERMIGVPFDGGTRWTFAHALDARPVVTGNVVVASGAGEAFALDARTGTVLWRHPTGGIPLLGAGDDGTTTVVTFRRAGAVGSTLLAVNHDGKVVREIETDRVLGVPAVLGQMAFVPWAGQYVSVIDLSTGDETARVTLREETSHAWTEGGSLWFGQAAFVRLDAHIRDASRGRASTALLPTRELPGTPKLMLTGSTPLPPIATAEDKARLYARPTATDAGAAIENARWYATYFRLAMGFAVDKGQLVWVRLRGADYVGGAAAPGGIVLCDERGQVTELDAGTGAVVRETDLGEPIQECVVSADGHRVSGDAGEKAAVQPLAEQLAQAVRADQPQLVTAQKLLLRELAGIEDDLATKTLVDVASDPRTSPDLLKSARAALAKRRNGTAYMESALERHYDFLKDVLRTPPVGPIAQALGAMKDKRAAPLLAAHLLDPADGSDDVKQAAAALAIVAGPEQLPALREFFAMYRASTDDDDDIAAAVVSVGQAMLSLKDKSARALVEAAAKDSSTASPVQEGLASLLGGAPVK